MYSILLGDGELVWVRVLEVSVNDSLDEYHVGVLCIVPWVRDVLLVCFWQNSIFYLIPCGARTTSTYFLRGASCTSESSCGGVEEVLGCDFHHGDGRLECRVSSWLQDYGSPPRYTALPGWCWWMVHERVIQGLWGILCVGSSAGVHHLLVVVTVLTS